MLWFGPAPGRERIAAGNLSRHVGRSSNHGGNFLSKRDTLRTVSAHDEAAIDVDRLAGDVAAALRGQEDGHRCDVPWLLPATQRDDPADLLGGPVLVGLTLL